MRSYRCCAWSLGGSFSAERTSKANLSRILHLLDPLSAPVPEYSGNASLPPFISELPQCKRRSSPFSSRVRHLPRLHFHASVTGRGRNVAPCRTNTIAGSGTSQSHVQDEIVYSTKLPCLMVAPGGCNRTGPNPWMWKYSVTPSILWKARTVAACNRSDSDLGTRVRNRGHDLGVLCLGA